MKKLRIAIDMDDVMANTSKKLLELHASLYGSAWQPADFKGLGFQELIKAEEYQVIRERIFEVGFFTDLEVLPNAIEVISHLHEHHEVFIVSAAMEFPNSLCEKQTWLGQYFPFIHWKNIVFCGDKSIITADVLIDDHEKNLITFQGIPLLFDAIHNQTLSGYRRVHSWLEVKDVIDELAYES